MSNETKLYKVIRYVFLIAACIFVIIPLVPLIFMAFKTGAEYSSTSVLEPPKNFLNTYNFAYAIRVGKLGRAFIYTAIILTISLFFQVTMTAMVAYVLHRFDFMFKKAVKIMFTLTMFIPVVATQNLIFRMMYAVGLVNTMWSVIILYSGVGIVGIYIMLNQLDNISREIDEAAMIDGAGYYYTFLHIIFPLMKPACTTMIIINGIGLYNDFYIPNLYLNRDVQTFTVALYKFFGSMSTPFEIVAAAIIIGMIPIMIVFIFLQKYIYNGLAGSVKM
ncbi:MAG: carbohydrate ABC transporter permease [Ruminococcus sp.]|nr:carbohydrate ABC transporter permease [Ruminococcus sp.]MBR1752648.1 carbohydrate ABC transporter permease [Ruminococcus sp.]MBR1864705.1 carbohydrate ABC transporter permease [Ruminococcus sp.]